MKNLSLTALVLLSVLTFSCTKQRDCCVLPYQPYITAEKNNVKWEAQVGTTKIAPDSIAITGSQTEERLIMRIKFAGKGTYTLTGNQAQFFTTIGQDVLTSYYNVDNTAVSTIEITEYDNNQAIITGTYSVTLKKAADRYPSYPESVKFLKGKFSTYLKN